MFLYKFDKEFNYVVFPNGLQKYKTQKPVDDGVQINAAQVQTLEREGVFWLRFITIFWNARVLKTAVKFGLAALIMNRYERIGFAILMLCIAL